MLGIHLTAIFPHQQLVSIILDKLVDALCVGDVTCGNLPYQLIVNPRADIGTCKLHAVVA